MTEKEGRRGFLKLLVLALLVEKDRHGYEIISEIAKLTKGQWKPTSGSLYPLLTQLERKGFIVSREEIEKGRRRKVYRITDKGIEKLLRMYETVEEIIVNVVRFLRSIRDKLRRYKYDEFVCY